MKIKCKTCKKIKTSSRFNKMQRGRRGYSYDCKLCTRKYHNAYNTNKDRYNREYHLRKFYKLTLNDYNNMLKKQNNKCSICLTPSNKLKRPLSIDHNHITGKIRGLICASCNHGLGCFKADNGIKLLKRAIIYTNNNN